MAATLNSLGTFNRTDGRLQETLIGCTYLELNEAQKETPKMDCFISRIRSALHGHAADKEYREDRISVDNAGQIAGVGRGTMAFVDCMEQGARFLLQTVWTSFPVPPQCSILNHLRQGMEC